jgi:hypothetical protein
VTGAAADTLGLREPGRYRPPDDIIDFLDRL